jgi:hypothetical protein
MNLRPMHLFSIGLGLIGTATATPGLSKQECGTLIGDLEPEAIDPIIVCICTESLMERIRHVD